MIQRKKRFFNEEVVIIMDSNRQYISSERFWNGHSCIKIKAGNIKEARKVLLESEFKRAKFIYIHVGTNDLENTQNIEDISRDLINLGSSLQRDYPDANVFISEVLVRSDFLNGKIIELNKLLERNMPESLFFIRHRNIKKEMLDDKKHIKKNFIQVLVGNLKHKLRETLKIVNKQTAIINNNMEISGEKVNNVSKKSSFAVKDNGNVTNTNVQNTNEITHMSNTLGQSKLYQEQNTVFTDEWKDVQQTNSQNNVDYNCNLNLTNGFKSLQFSNNNLTPEFGETCCDVVNDENIEYTNSSTKYRSKGTSRPQTVVNLYPDRDTLLKTVRPGHHASYTDAVIIGRKTAIFSTSITKGIRIKDFNEIYRSGSACFRRFHGSRANGMKYHVIPTMIEEKPEVIVIHTGGNDLRTPKNNPISVETIVNSIIDAGKVCESYGAKCIIISGVIIRNTGYMETRRREINNLLKGYKNGYLFIDNDLIKRDNLYDGVHLNEEGSVILAKNILHALNNL